MQLLPSRAPVVNRCPRKTIPPSARSVRTLARKGRSSTKESANGTEPSNAKAAAFQKLLSNLNSKFGPGTVMQGKDMPLQNCKRFSSGCMNLDLALGGGWPLGRIIEIYGPESCGKTTLALHAIAEVQKLAKESGEEMYVMYVDVEQAIDPEHVKRLGVDMNNWSMTQPSCGEEALQIAEDSAQSGAVSLVVVDSVSALVPRAELEGDIGQQSIGLQARLMSQALRKLAASAAKNDCTIIFINQLRQKVGVIYGNPEVTSGGMSLKYFASLRVELRKKETLQKTGGDAIGIKVKAKMVKNKVAPPLKEAIFDIYFTHGIDSVGSLVDTAEQLKVLVRKGAWFSLNGDNLGQGRDKTIERLNSDPALLAQIQELTREAMNSLAAQAAEYHSSNGLNGSYEDDLLTEEDEYVEPAEEPHE